MSQQETDEDKTASESANDHFHRLFIVFSVKAAGYQRPNYHAVKRADNRIARQGTSPGRTADKFVVGKPKAAADQGAD